MLASCARPHRPAPQQTPAPPQAPGAPASAAPYGFVYTPPANAQNADPQAPRILEIDLNANVLSAPGPIRVRVLTTAAVNAVVARTMGRELGVPEQAPGVFGADDQLPNIPFFLRNRTYNVQFVATTPDGRSVTTTIPLTLH
jgi:hypothetical protein